MRHSWALRLRRHDQTCRSVFRRYPRVQAKQSHWIHAEEIEHCSRLIDVLDIGALAGESAECLLVSVMQGALVVLRRTTGLKRSFWRVRVGCSTAGAEEAFGRAVDQGTTCCGSARTDSSGGRNG